MPAPPVLPAAESSNDGAEDSATDLQSVNGGGGGVGDVDADIPVGGMDAANIASDYGLRSRILRWK